MNKFLSLLDAAANNNGGGLGDGMMITIIYVVVFGAIIYFGVLRPQKKRDARQRTMLSSMEIGDSVLTTSGFYGVIIDISEDTVIVEFGSNKNCRIPMTKAAIADIEKANQGE